MVYVLFNVKMAPSCLKHMIMIDIYKAEFNKSYTSNHIIYFYLF